MLLLLLKDLQKVFQALSFSTESNVLSFTPKTITFPSSPKIFKNVLYSRFMG